MAKAKRTLTGTHAPKPAALPALLAAAKRAQTAAQVRGEALLAIIARRKLRITEDFYDIAAALHELQAKKLFVPLGFASFGELLDQRVKISRSQALKLVLVAANYTREEALQLGLEKSYQLVRYTEATPEPDNPHVLLQTGAKIANKSIAQASVQDLVNATRAVQAANHDGHPVDPKVTAHTKQAKKLQADLRKRGAPSATVTARRTKNGWRLVIEIPPSEAGAV